MTNFVTPGPTSTRARNIFRIVDTFTINANEFYKNYALKNVYSKSESSINLLKVGSKAFTFHAMVKASPGTHLECPTIVTRITLILLSGTGKFNYSLRATDLWITKIFCTVLQSFIYNTNG